MKPGIYLNVDWKTYHSIKAVSNSYLGRLADCPAKALIEQEVTPALLFGQALHAYVLEGAGIFNRRFAVAPDCDRRTKEGKERWLNFAAQNLLKPLISMEDYVKIKGIKTAIGAHPSANTILMSGNSEITIIWIDAETGILCKGRLDRIPSGVEGVIIDLKSTRDASEHAFCRSIISYGYARQGAMYMEGCFCAGELETDRFILIAVESELPYRVEVYNLDSDFLGWGYDEFHRLMRLEKKCRDQGIYPHFQNPGIIDLMKPGYLTSQEF